MSFRYHRMIGYSGTLALHLSNGLAMILALHSDVMKSPDPDLKLFGAMQYRFVTVWNLIFQSLYAGVSLGCELYDWMEFTQFVVVRKKAEAFRNSFFCAIVWPFTVSIACVFWPIYLYDRELVFPAYIDKVLSQVSNHIMHTAILGLVLGELTYNPRNEPQSHEGHFILYSKMFLVYVGTLYFTHWQLGAWPYPILSCFSYSQLAIFLLFIWVGSWCSYYLQYTLTPVMSHLVKKKTE